MPEVDQKLMDNFSFLISTVDPNLSKKALTFLLGGHIGTGPSFNEIGGKGIALTISIFFLIIFFNWDKVIVEMKLITFWFDRNFKSLIIFLPTSGVMDKKTQSELSITFWLFLDITILLNFFFNLSDIFLFLGEINIFLYLILELHMPKITDEAILPVPINPIFMKILISEIKKNP